MRNLTRLLLVLAVVSLFPSGHLRAEGEADYLTTYYDADQQAVGWYREDCDHNETWDGTQDGVWKEIDATSCTIPGYSSTYYHKCNGVWVQVGFIGSSAC